MAGFEQIYLGIAQERAALFLSNGTLVNDVFSCTVNSLYSDPFHRTQFIMNGHLTVARVASLLDRLGLYEFILNWRSSDHGPADQ